MLTIHKVKDGKWQIIRGRRILATVTRVGRRRAEVEVGSRTLSLKELQDVENAAGLLQDEFGLR